MPTPLQLGLLLGLIAVAVVHTRSRLAGAVFAAVWVAVALAWGIAQFRMRASVHFLGIDLPPWIFYGFFTGLLVFNVAVIVRALRRRPAVGVGHRAGTGPSRGGP